MIANQFGCLHNEMDLWSRRCEIHLVAVSQSSSHLFAQTFFPIFVFDFWIATGVMSLFYPADRAAFKAMKYSRYYKSKLLVVL